MTKEVMSQGENKQVILSDAQKGYIIAALEADLSQNLDTYDDPAWADQLNNLYKELTGKDHQNWEDRRKK